MKESGRGTPQASLEVDHMLSGRCQGREPAVWGTEWAAQAVHTCWCHGRHAHMAHARWTEGSPGLAVFGVSRTRYTLGIVWVEDTYTQETHQHSGPRGSAPATRLRRKAQQASPLGSAPRAAAAPRRDGSGSPPRRRGRGCPPPNARQSSEAAPSPHIASDTARLCWAALA